MFTPRRRARGIALQALLGAASGLFASWVMERAQTRISAMGSDETKEREKRAQGGRQPATYRAAEAAAHLVGRSIPEARRPLAGELVHYATGAVWGALFGALAAELRAPVIVGGVAWGALVWLLNDELLAPSLGLSGAPTRYPASTHGKALAAHLVYGTATGAGFRALSAITH